MKALQILPEEYRELFAVDLEKNRNLSLIINILALGIALVLAGIGHLFVPFSALFASESGAGGLLIRYLVLAVAFIAYVILHELTHGITMKIFGCQKVTYGFTGLYAYSGSNEYFKKIPYLVIALAPVVFWGIVLTLVCIFVPISWFWVFFIIQIINLSGAAGDFYVTIRVIAMPKTILVQDIGISMTIFAEQKPHEETLSQNDETEKQS